MKRLLLLSGFFLLPAAFAALPHAIDDFASTLEETPVSIDVLANDFDLDSVVDPAQTQNNNNNNNNTPIPTTPLITDPNDPNYDPNDPRLPQNQNQNNNNNNNNQNTQVLETLSIISYTQPTDGFVVQNGNSLDYTPPADFTGTVIFRYSITDGRGHFDAGRVTVTVIPVDDPVTAATDTFVLVEDGPVQTWDVLANDINPDDDQLFITNFSPTQGGTLQLNIDFTFSYTVDPDFSGNDSFTYSVTDGRGNVSTATVNIIVIAINDAPTTSGLEDTDANSNDADLVLDLSTVFDDAEDGPNGVDLSFTVLEGTTTNCGTSDPDVFDAVTITGANGVRGTPASGGARIHNGTEATPGAWPWMVALVQSGSQSAAAGQFCGGTLIAPDWVLTAAHCVEGETAAGIDVVIGRHDLNSSGGERIPAAQLIMHPDYNNTTLSNDIALIRLSRPSNAPTIRPVMPSEANLFAAGVSATIAGWGTRFEGDTGSDVILQINLPIVDNATANQSNQVGPFDATMLAAGVDGGPQLPCPGDSGGPLMVPDGRGNFVQAGIVSFISPIGCVDPNTYSGYVRVATFYDWVVSNVGTLGDDDSGGGILPARSLVLDFKPHTAGCATIIVEATDSQGLSVSTTFTVTITDVNDPVVAIPDTFVVAEDSTGSSLNVLANDTDTDGDLLTVQTFTNPSNGTLSKNSDETFDYTPTTDFTGNDSFTYVVTDNRGSSATGTVSLTVSPVNDAPTGAIADFAVAAEDADTLLDLFAAFDDVDNTDDELNFELVGNSNPDLFTALTFEGTPLQLFRLDYDDTIEDGVYTAVLIIRATDPAAGTVDVSFTVTVTQANTAPVATADFELTDEDTPVIFDPLGNDSDPDGDSFRIVALTQPTNGLATVVNGQLRYSPDADFNGNDSFTYTIADERGLQSSPATVSILVLLENDAPIAIADIVFATEDTPIVINPIANDIDPDAGDSLTLVSVLSDNYNLANNTYTPVPDFNGTLVINYIVRDRQGLSDTGAILLVIEPVNDPPEPLADLATTTEDVPVTIDVLANDSDPDGDTLIIFSTSDTDAAIDGNGDIEYTPDPDFAGTTLITYNVRDGQGGSANATILINVVAEDDAPIVIDDAYTTAEDTPIALDLLDNDSDPEGATLTIIDIGSAQVSGTTYTPVADFAGDDSFSYSISDGINTVTGQVTITVTPVNDAPEAPAQFAVVTSEDLPVTIDLLGPVTDPDGDTVSVARIVSGTSQGTLSPLNNGSITYSPRFNYHGTDSLTFDAIDGEGGSTPVTVTITITPADDVPQANADAYSTTVNTTLSASTVLANDTDLDSDPITATLAVGPANGTLDLAADGTFTYVPLAEFAGTDSFTYRASADQADSPPATVTIRVTVVPTNPPVATPDAFTTPEDTSLPASVLSNDSDADGDSLTATLLTNPANGDLTFNADGSFVYTPVGDFAGDDSFSYQITDGTSTASADATIAVTPVNDPPEAPAQFIVHTLEDTPLPINLIGPVTDPDNDPLTIASIVASPANGSLSLPGLYSPSAEFSGTDSFTYAVADGQGGLTNVTVSINVTEVNDPPTANDDAYSTTVNTTLAGSTVLANDFDPDTASLTAEFVTGPANGTLTLATSGAFTYVPLTDFEGDDSFTYRVDGGTTDSDPATVTIRVQAAVTNAPVATADFASTTEDTPVTIDVLANDRDADGDSLSVVSFSSQAISGTTYTPAADFNGVDTFTYIVTDGSSTDIGTVTVTIDAVNDAPAAPAQFIVETLEDTPLAIDLLGPISDIDGDTLTIAQLTDLPDNGTFANGTYTPDSEFSGTDAFTYSVIDGNGGLTSVTVTINVTEVNDPPTANDDAYSTTVNSTLTASTVLANDFDPDTATLTAAFVTGPANGALTLATTGAFTYVPLTDFEGADSFTYRADGGTTDSTPATVTITVSATPTNAPVAIADFASTTEDNSVTIDVLANDSDADGDTLSVVSYSTQAISGTTYTPAADFNGVDTFTYIVTDGSSTDVGTVTVTIDAVNDAPTAPAQFALITAEDIPLPVNLLGPLSDVDGDPVSISRIISGPSNGTFAFPGLYRPDSEYSGTDQITYEAIDGQGGATTVTLTINITPINDPPTANDDAYSTTVNTTLTASTVLANDFDIDTSSLTAAFVTGPANGTLTLAASGAFTYVPLTDFEGVDSFTYRADGGTTDSAPATVTITVSATPTNAPVATADFASTTEDSAVTIDVLANDTDADGDTLSVVSYSTQAISGTTYTPAADFNGVDTFTYIVTDGSSTDIGTVTVTIDAANDAPAAPAQFAVETAEDTAVAIDLLGPVTDVDGDTLTVAQFTDLPDNGTFAGGSYIPDAEFSGTDSLSYSVIDGNGGATTVTVAINVTPVNDPPTANDDAYSTTVNTTLTGSTVLANDFDPDTATLTAAFVTGPANGTLTLATTGAFTYVPLTDFEGVDSFTYRADGGTTDSTPATVSITVAVAPSSAPVALADFANTTEDNSVTIDVLANDTDADGDTLSVISYSTQAISGTTYTPAADFNGVDTFTYVVSDGSNTDVGTVTVSVIAVNDAPTAPGQFIVETAEDTPIAIDLLAPISDIDGDTVSVARISAGPANGSFLLGNYAPDAEYSGTDQISYEAIDGNGGLTTLTVTINVTPVNDPPTANDDAYSTTVNTTLTGSTVLANDFDVDTSSLTADFVTGPANGTLTLAASGAFTYVPLTGFEGVDSFTYRADGGSTDSTPATVTITVSATPTNAPVAVADFATTNEDTPVTIDVLGNDTDADGDTLSVVSFFSQAISGTTYTPAADFNGVDTFTYIVTDGSNTDVGTVTVTVAAVNDAPAAPAQFAVETAEDTPVALDLLAPVSDVDGDTITLSRIIAGPANGSFLLGTYAPDAEYSGTDQISYEAIDGNGGATTVTVTINVTPVNDPPVANDDAYSTTVNTTLTASTVLANDFDVDTSSLTADFVTGPANGTLTLAASGAFTYVPLTGFEGVDSFTYRADGGSTDSTPATVTITVSATPTNAPVAVADSAITTEDIAVAINVLANDSDADGDTLSIVDIGSPQMSGTTYTPAADFNGVDTFTYIVTDGSSTAIGTVTVTITAVNDAPAAPAQFTVQTLEDTPVSIDLLAPVGDIDGDSLVLAQINTAPGNGSFANGVYTPDAEFSGADGITYTVIDGNGGSTTVTATINVTAVNDAPVANDDAYSTTVNTTLTASTVLANDFDVDTSSLTADFVTGPANGTLTLAASGAFTYVPLTGFEGVDSFTYRADGGTTDSTPATVTITVSAAPTSPPVAVADIATTAEDTPVAITLLVNDTDADGDTLSIVDIGSPQMSGTTYTPVADFNGVDTFSYTVTDGSSTDVGTVTVTITAVNDAPAAPAQFAVETAEDTAVAIDLLAPVSDIDGDTIVLSQINTAPTNGSFANGVYTPDAEFSGADSIVYTVIDGNGGSTTITATINVTDVNDAPVANPDAYSTTVNTTLTGSTVLANDFDIDTSSLTAAFVTGPANGTLTLAASGAFTYVPLGGFQGVDSFTYRADGGTTNSTPATVTITVSVVPTSPPVAVADSAITTEDNAIAINFLANDTDADGDTLSIVDIGSPQVSGTTYTPADDFNGVDTFTYIVTDGSSTAQGTVTVTVTAVNDAPEAPAQLIRETSEDTPLPINFTAGFTDVDGDTLAVSAFTSLPTNGSLIGNTYRPAADYAGPDSIGFTVVDGNGGSTNGTLTINVTAVNDAPQPNGDAYTVAFGKSLTVVAAGGLLANDDDVDSTSLSTLLVNPPAGGTLTLLSTGAFTYVPLAAFVGTDNFTYRVTDGDANSAPASVNISVQVLDGSGDFNASSTVDQADLDLFLPHFGESAGDAGYDDQFDLIDNDTIDVNDLSFLIGLITNNSRGLADFLDSLDDAMASIKLVGPTEPVQVGETFHVEVWLEDLSLTAAGLRGGAFDLAFDSDLASMIADSLATTLQPPFNEIFANGLSLDGLLQALSGFTLQDGLGANGAVHFATIPFVAQEAGSLVLSANPGDWHLVMAPPVGQLSADNVEFGDDLVIEIVNSLIELSNDYIELPLNAPALDLLNGVFADGPVIVSGSVNRRAPGVYEVSYTLADGTTVTRTYEVTQNWELPLTLGDRILTIGFDESANVARAVIDLVGQVRDLRNPADQETWTVSVTAFAGDTLRWSGNLLPAGTLLIENLATGQVINMAAVESLELIPGAQDLVITYHAGVETFDLTLAPGWNAVSLPFAPLDSNVDAVFGNAKTGPVWTYDGSDMISVSEIHPGQAYWIENPADSATTVRTQGIAVADLSLRLREGWNFIGLPAGTVFDTASLPADADVDIFAWDGYSYQRVEGPLTPGIGYWVMSNRAVVLPLR